jgi:hypothetical protein
MARSLVLDLLIKLIASGFGSVRAHNTYDDVEKGGENLDKTFRPSKARNRIRELHQTLSHRRKLFGKIYEYLESSSPNTRLSALGGEKKRKFFGNRKIWQRPVRQAAKVI